MKSRQTGLFSHMIAAAVGLIKPSYKLTSGYRQPNRKRRRRTDYVKQGPGKLGMRGYDGTMYGPFRSRQGGW